MRNVVVIGLISVAFVIGLWSYWPAKMRAQYPNSAEKLEPGTHGDMYGSLNALFTGLALVGVGVTIWMQAEQLRRQKAEHDASEAARKEELRIAHVQLKMATEQHAKELEHEKRRAEREAREAEPVFVFKWDKFSPTGLGYTVTSVGGAVSHVSAEPGKIEPDDYVSRDRGVGLSFPEAQHEEDFGFSIHYRRVADQKNGQQMFRVRGKNGAVSRADHLI